MNTHDLKKIAQACKKLPLYSQDWVEVAEKIVPVLLYCPHIGRTWYICEYDPKTKIAFGWVEGYVLDSSCDEWGYTSLNELVEFEHIQVYIHPTTTKLTELTSRAD